VETSPAVPNRKRFVALVVLGCVAAGSAASLGVGLTTWPLAEPSDPTRALSAAEAGRLAAMRVTNYRDGRAGLRATLGAPEAPTQLTGWVDWSRGLVYLSLTGSGAGAQRGLLQAVPGVLASRPEPSVTPPRGAASPTTAAASPAAAAATVGPDRTPVPVAADRLPPAVPPADGWRVRRLTATGAQPAPLDSFISMLFAIAADRPDAADALKGSGARWLGREKTGGTTVDVLLGPAVATLAPASPATARTPPAGPATTRTPSVRAAAQGRGSPAGPAQTPLAGMGGAVRYWLDGDARLHRLEALLAGDVPVRIDLDRAARPDLIAIDALGGRPARPRKVTGPEADLLASMGTGNWARGGARVSLAVPTAPAANQPPANLRGAGWVDWYNSLAYLAIHELDRPADVVLLRAGTDGVAVRAAPRAPARSGSAAALPPLPPPSERGWTYRDWRQRSDGLGGLDVDLLVNEALSAGSSGWYDRSTLRASAVWLRGDVIAGRKVTVFEIPKAPEAGTARGQARLRYWVDGSGLLRRLELRTRTGAFAQLNLEPGPVPYVPPVPIS
jgi:hypothetical protein